MLQNDFWARTRLQRPGKIHEHQRKLLGGPQENMENHDGIACQTAFLITNDWKCKTWATTCVCFDVLWIRTLSYRIQCNKTKDALNIFLETICALCLPQPSSAGLIWGAVLGYARLEDRPSWQQEPASRPVDRPALRAQDLPQSFLRLG